MRVALLASVLGVLYMPAAAQAQVGHLRSSKRRSSSAVVSIRGRF